MEKATIFDYVRLCKTQDECSSCPLGDDVCNILDMSNSKLETASEKILKWCVEHPVETRQDRFLTQYPNAVTNENGRISICPKHLDGNYKCILKPNKCGECLNNYWLAEVSENE